MMADINERPIVFPLSNPATSAECDFATAMKYTDNRVLFASGTAFPSYRIPDTETIRYPNQGNNMYIFPGLGLGSLVAKACRVTDNMISGAAMTLADSMTDEEISQGLLYPRLQRIREVSARIAAVVAVQAVLDGVADE